MSFVKYTSIETLGHAWKQLHRRNISEVKYGSKIKLHGTNGGIRVNIDGTVQAQKRTSDVHVGSDNAGFAAWVETCKQEWFDALPKGLDEPEAIIFGEWAGPGVQKSDAVTMIKEKHFFVFAVQLGDDMISEPEIIRQFVPDLPNVIVLPWFHEPKVISVGDTAKVNEWVDLLNDDVEKIGERDPFIFEKFGVEGVGEGLVITPANVTTREFYSVATFKAKSEAHRVKHSSKAVKTRIEVPASVGDFARDFVTDARCEQAVTEACEGEYERPRMGAFMKWIGNDIQKESVEELAGLGLEWKQVAGAVNKIAANWYLTKCDKIS
jgi:hypothetical protein